MLRCTSLFLLAVFVAFPAQAKTKFRYPMAKSGTYITAYYDLASGSGIRDWNGGRKTYNGHPGSDYAIGGFGNMDKGVWIYAGAKGTVVDAVDGQADRCTSGKCTPCNGNYVRLRHSDGTHSYYVHMKRGSVRVKRGQKVQCGDRLGKVGSSGCSTGPHLHFQVNTSSAYATHVCPFKKNFWVAPGAYLKHPSIKCQECQSGNTRNCYNGPAGTKNVGICKPGTQKCVQSRWEACKGQIKPRVEQCDGKDNNCNGKTDENNPGGGAACQQGECAGAQTCKGGTLVCVATPTTTPEACDGKDNNCNGQIDEGCGTACTDGQTQSCYSGPAGTQGVGTCKAGTQTCAAGSWGPCTGEVTPQAQEVCNNALDDNCDGQTDEGCTTTCTDGQTQNCYTGPVGTQNIGTCQNGTQTCAAGSWGPCTGEVTPQAQEVCNNALDDNCDGQTDEGCNPAAACVDNDKDGYGVGAGCTTPQDCDDTDPNVHPGATEICDNEKDDDCRDGDEPCPDKPRLPMGKTGCTQPEDCDTNFCANVGAINRCSQPCTDNRDCPAGYECYQQTACWPSNTIDLNPPGNPNACQSDQDCPSGESCSAGTCVRFAKSTGCSCQQQNGHHNMGLPFLLLTLCLLFWRQRHTQPH